MRSFQAKALGLTLAAFSAGCDSEPTIPAPPPQAPVASVTLSRDTATVPIGGTVQLAVTLRDAQGTELNGRTIAWTSTAPATASVSTTGLVTATALGHSKIVATAEGISDTATVRVPPAPATVTLEPGSAKAVTIGPEGGTIQTTDADGVQYSLQIPALALMAPVAITMTPLANATGLPLSGGFVAGVDFRPSGLKFAQPATLTIVTSAEPGAGQRLVGLTYEGAGEALALTAAKRESSTLTLAVSHFSGVIAGFGTKQDIDALFVPVTTEASQLGTSDNAIDLLIQHAIETPRDGALELHLMEGWFDAVILPTLDQAATDVQLIQAVGEYEQWHGYWPEFLELYLHIPGGKNAPSLVVRRTLWELEFVTKVKLAIAGNNQLCAAPGLTPARVAALNNALFWHRIARFLYHVATPENGLDVAALRAGLCATAISQNLVLPDPLVEGQAQGLEVTFALKFTDGVVVPANFVVTTTGQGADLHFPTATALTPPGYYAGLVTPTGGTVTLDLAACYHGGQVAGLIADEICHSLSVVRDVDSALTINTTTLSAGTVGSSYSTTLQASGGSGSYQWSLINGQLPPGLSLAQSGAITGTPSAAGTSNFTAQVVSGTHTAERAFAISITQQQPPPPPPPPPSGSLEWHFDTDLEGWSCNSTNNCKWQLLTSNQHPVTSGWVALQSIGAAVSRTIAIPSTARVLRFDAATHNVPGDVSRVQVQISGVTVLDSVFVNPGSNTAFNFVTMTIDLSAQAGQTVNIRFVQQDDGAGSGTTLKIDNIRIEAN